MQNKTQLQTYFRNNALVNHYNINESDYNLIEVLMPVLGILNSAIGSLSTDASQISVAVPVYLFTVNALDAYYETITPEAFPEHHDLAKSMTIQITTKFKARFDFIKNDNMLLSAALIDPYLKSQEINMDSLITVNKKTELITYMVTLARDLRLFEIETDTDDIVKRELLTYTGLSSQVFSMVVSDTGKNQWHAVSKGFKNVARIGMVFQTIAASSSAIERAFSHSNRLITPDRNRLSSAMVDAVTFLNGNEDILRTSVDLLEDSFYLPLEDAAASSANIIDLSQ